MSKICLSLTAFLLTVAVYGQYTLRVKILDAVSKRPLSFASVSPKGVPYGVTADSMGLAQLKLSGGKNTLVISYIGYETQRLDIVMPVDSILVIELTLSDEGEEEVVIQSVRTTRTIRDIPTRVEFVAGEELDEKANMKPGDIRMVLNESTGIMTQQTSAVSANASIRIQGLDGRYTQMLRDGLPLYAGFSGGLGLLQTPPLDLKQFEVIKGSSSTLYGGGAIAGLVDLVSKTPEEKRELKFHLDATSAGGLNTSGFFGQRFGKTGMTIFASRNSNSAYDPSDVGLTAIPEFERYTINPKFFWYINERTDLIAGVNLTTEERTGGDIEFIEGRKPMGYYEMNNSDRYSTQFVFTHRMKNDNLVMIKNSINHFKRHISQSGYDFSGLQNGTYTEITYARRREKTEWVTGMNVVTDHFDEDEYYSTPSRDYTELTTGAFVQNNLKVNEMLGIESGFRLDYVMDYGVTALPRIALLFKYSPKLSSRIGGGLGYKIPNIFTEESERLLYKNVFPVDPDQSKLEKSYGVNGDLNYRTKFADGEVNFSINQLFFYTRINHPLLLQENSGNYYFINTDGHFDSRGMETNVKLGYRDFKLFLGYTFTNALLHEGTAKKDNYLTPKHRLNSVLLFEMEEKWKIGLEAYYFSNQHLSDGATGKSYWITGFMAEKLWEKISLYINFENFTDTRQTKFDTIYTGTIDNPRFRDIYAPLDGFVVNGGVKLRL